MALAVVGGDEGNPFILLPFALVVMGIYTTSGEFIAKYSGSDTVDHTACYHTDFMSLSGTNVSSMFQAF